MNIAENYYPHLNSFMYISDDVILTTSLKKLDDKEYRNLLNLCDSKKWKFMKNYTKKLDWRYAKYFNNSSTSMLNIKYTMNKLIKLYLEFKKYFGQDISDTETKTTNPENEILVIPPDRNKKNYSIRDLYYYASCVYNTMYNINYSLYTQADQKKIYKYAKICNNICNNIFFWNKDYDVYNIGCPTCKSPHKHMISYNMAIESYRHKDDVYLMWNFLSSYHHRNILKCNVGSYNIEKYEDLDVEVNKRYETLMKYHFGYLDKYKTYANDLDYEHKCVNPVKCYCNYIQDTSHYKMIDKVISLEKICDCSENECCKDCNCLQYYTTTYDIPTYLVPHLYLLYLMHYDVPKKVKPIEGFDYIPYHIPEPEKDIPDYVVYNNIFKKPCTSCLNILSKFISQETYISVIEIFIDKYHKTYVPETIVPNVYFVVNICNQNIVFQLEPTLLSEYANYRHDIYNPDTDIWLDTILNEDGFDLLLLPIYYIRLFRDNATIELHMNIIKIIAKYELPSLKYIITKFLSDERFDFDVDEILKIINEGHSKINGDNTDLTRYLYDYKLKKIIRSENLELAYTFAKTYISEETTKFIESYDKMIENRKIIIACEKFEENNSGEYQHLKCPITQTFMADPVVAEDGITYERSAIVDWFKVHQSSPMTRKKIKSDLYSNFFAKNVIEVMLTTGSQVARGSKGGYL